jgi:hypothetical protein
VNQTLVVGDGLPVERGVQALASSGREARAWSAPPERADADGSSTALAGLLVELERELERDRPATVVLADDSDAALAAALVATKLLIDVELADGVAGADSINARLVTQLATSYAEPR